jgi:hypothetical protein
VELEIILASAHVNDILVYVHENIIKVLNKRTVLQSRVDKLIEVGRGYGMEINVEKTKSMRISRQPTPLQIKIRNRWRMWKSLTIWVARSQIMQGVHEKLRPGLSWQKQHSTGTISTPAN